MSDPSNQLLDLARDVEQIDCADWPSRTLPADLAGRRDGFQVVISADALQRIHKQGKSNLKAEVGGVLVGNGYQDEHGPYLWIEAIIEGRSMRHHAAQVTFTAETWADIQTTMDRDHPDARIVGWYHTHPGFGIFLSEMDLFIQDNFFNLPWQTALVYDPKSGEEGVFVWREGRTQREEFLTVGRAGKKTAGGKRKKTMPEPSESLIPPSQSASSSSLSSAFPPATLEELAARQLDLERRVRLLSRRGPGSGGRRRARRVLGMSLLFAAGFVLGWWMSVRVPFPLQMVENHLWSATTRPVK
jgi:proteasome lid subunit RPN8/RPN11